ncbi:DUF2470 domain-containing protein [Pseudonocardiaceae bacterium YIM PH 21723]|nr:DUF2470 domain-containing protein [Pseudonocardiaceae bacterium YIM PH 21723]
MVQSTQRRPAAPTPAERARTIAARGGRAALLPAHESGQKATPVLHHVYRDARACVLLDDNHPLVDAAWAAPREELAVMLELADNAPVQLREPVRGLLWITGWLRPLNPGQARAEAISVAEERPDPRLLDVGHGKTLLIVQPASLVLADGEGTCSLKADDFAVAKPDPFCLMEDDWLRHLEISHREVVGLLAKHLPSELRGGHIRPLGLDRLGLRLRVEAPGEDHDVRLAFAQPVSNPRELAIELRRLVGCPFLTSQ